jgi:hypothetical protein
MRQACSISQPTTSRETCSTNSVKSSARRRSCPYLPAPPPDGNVKAYRVDWAPDGDSSPAALETRAAMLLDSQVYQTSSAFDALNRIKLARYPQNVDGARKELHPTYNRAGVLEQVSLDGAIYVNRIAYNAKGQRALVAYGNGVMTRYAYDDKTFRLLRLRTERFTAPAPETHRPAGTVLQDFGYHRSWRLIASFKRVGCSNGRPAGRAPLSTRSMRGAMRSTAAPSV